MLYWHSNRITSAARTADEIPRLGAMARKAFISSTFEDLKDHRSHVITALRRAGIHVDPMEEWTAAADEPKVFSTRRMHQCDLCVLLVARRRGYVPPNEQLSITQMEYQYAVTNNIDILVFLLRDEALWHRRYDDFDSDPVLCSWRQSLCERHGVAFLTTRRNPLTSLRPSLGGRSKRSR